MDKKIESKIEYQEIQCSIIALSSYTGDNHKNRALKSGMKEYLNKPLNKKELQIIMN